MYSRYLAATDSIRSETFNIRYKVNQFLLEFDHPTIAITVDSVEFWEFPILSFIRSHQKTTVGEIFKNNSSFKFMLFLECR